MKNRDERKIGQDTIFSHWDWCMARVLLTGILCAKKEDVFNNLYSYDILKASDNAKFILDTLGLSPEKENK